MNTRTTCPRGRDGFTMIEVMIAMVILAVGLLGLEALGIRAARSVAMANQNSRAAETATQYLESAMDSLSRGLIPAELSCQTAAGEQVVRSVNLANSRLPQVAVTVTPPAAGTATAAPITVNSYVYSWNPIAGAVSASGVCA